MSRSTILIFPTEFERAKVADRLNALELSGDVRSLICGFGVITSAITASRIAASTHPSDCQFVLCGIAGSLSDSLQIGCAYQFKSVACYGIGAGNGPSYQSALEMGWSNGMSYRLKCSDAIADDCTAECLVTVCSASANSVEADEKRHKIPNASAEDMETYSVAEATLGFDLYVVRGISNRAGNRIPNQWKIDEAMASVMDIVERIVIR